MTALAIMGFTLPIAFNPKNTLTWNANTESDLAGYKIYTGTAPRTYGPPIDVGKTATPNSPFYKLGDLGLADGNYFMAVTAYDTTGNESGFSAEVVVPYDGTPPSNPVKWWREKLLEWWGKV